MSQDDSKVGGFSIESDGLEDIDEPKAVPVIPAVLASNKTSNASQSQIHINAAAMILNETKNSTEKV